MKKHFPLIFTLICFRIFAVQAQSPGTVTPRATTVCTLSVGIETITGVSCYGDSNARAVAIITNGTAPYTFHWNGNAGTGDTTTGLGAGIYTVSVTDGNQCTANAADTITQPLPLTVSTDSVAQTAPCNGLAAVTANGGTAPYTYFWQTAGQITDTINNQCNGVYCCIVSDHNYCSQTVCITVNLATGVNDVTSAAGISIYPEPNNGRFIIDGLVPEQVIELYDYNGQRLNSLAVVSATMNFNISDKPDGIYLLRVLSRDGSLVGQQRALKVQ